MKSNYIKYFAGAALLLTVVITSCTKMDSTYSEFLKGERIYVGKADSVKVHAGFMRVELDWLLIADPKVSAYKVYWNNRADSITGNVTRTTGIDQIKLLIDRNLQEGPVNFEIFTFDKEGNTSVRVEASGNVYGDNFKSQVYNRGFEAIPAMNEGTTLNIRWFPAVTGDVGTRVTYTSKAGVEKSIVAPPTEAVTAITDALPGTKITMQTTYEPESDSYDEYQVPTKLEATVPVFDRQLSKTLFKEYKLPSDQPTGFGWVMPRLWDNAFGGANNFATQSVAATTPINRWFTFDLGQVSTLSRYRVWQSQDRIFRDENAVEWEIWGATAPNPDGSFDGWTKLMTNTQIKPSGSPLGTVTAADQAFAAAGTEYIFPAGLPEVRYIRIKVIRNYANQTFMTFGEMSFWAKEL